MGLDLHQPSRLCWDWVFSQPVEIVIIPRLRENTALWAALCAEIGGEEREACAVKAEMLNVSNWSELAWQNDEIKKAFLEGAVQATFRIAAAIRARGR